MEIYKVFGYYGPHGEPAWARTQGDVFFVGDVEYGVTEYEPVGPGKVTKLGIWKVSELSTGLCVATGPTKIAARSNAVAKHKKVEKYLLQRVDN